MKKVRSSSHEWAGSEDKEGSRTLSSSWCPTWAFLSPGVWWRPWKGALSLSSERVEINGGREGYLGMRISNTEEMHLLVISLMCGASSVKNELWMVVQAKQMYAVFCFLSWKANSSDFFLHSLCQHMGKAYVSGCSIHCVSGCRASLLYMTLLLWCMGRKGGKNVKCLNSWQYLISLSAQKFKH